MRCKRSCFEVPFLLILFLLVVLPAGGDPAEGIPEGAPETGQVLTADRHGRPVRLIDLDYRFSLRRELGTWRFLKEEAFLRLDPDSPVVAGIESEETGTVLTVTVDHVPGLTDEAYLRQLIHFSLVDLEGKRLLREERIDLPSGDSSLEVDLEGGYAGQDPRYRGMRFGVRIRLLRRGPYLFGLQARGYADRFRDDLPDVEWMMDAFRFEEGPVRPRRSPEWEGEGIGWEVREGRFVDGLHGVEVRPGGAWRLLAGPALRSLPNEDALVGLHALQPRIVQLLRPVAAPGVEPERAVAWELDGLAGRIGWGEPDDVREVRVGGTTATERRWLGVDGPDRQRDYALVLLHREGILWRILTWWDAADRPAALEILDASYEGVRWRPAGDRGIGAGLGTVEAIGPGYVLRDGRFEDFEGGLTFRMPETGDWIPYLGERAGARVRDARLVLEEARLGIRVGIGTAGTGLAPREYHNAFLNGWEALRTEGLDPVRAGGRLHFVHGDERGIDGRPTAIRWITTTEGEWNLWVVVSGPPGGVASFESDGLADFLAGAGFLPADRRMTSVEGGVFLDLRLGYRVGKGEEGWIAREITPAGLEGIGSAAVVKRDGEMAVAALAVPAGFRAFHSIGSLLEELGLSTYAPDGEGTGSVLSGRTGERWRLRGERDDRAHYLQCWLVRRGPVQFVVIADPRVLEGNLDDAVRLD